LAGLVFYFITWHTSGKLNIWILGWHTYAIIAG